MAVTTLTQTIFETGPVFQDVIHTKRKDRTDEAPSFEERVVEVLENGGFLSRPRTVRAAKAGVDVYEYQRLSRDGGPLTGDEARRPPVYTLTAWGTLALSCSCPQAKRTRTVCKQQAALTRSLLGRINSDGIGGGDE